MEKKKNEFSLTELDVMSDDEKDGIACGVLVEGGPNGEGSDCTHDGWGSLGAGEEAQEGSIFFPTK